MILIESVGSDDLRRLIFHPPSSLKSNRLNISYDKTHELLLLKPFQTQLLSIDDKVELQSDIDHTVRSFRSPHMVMQQMIDERRCRVGHVATV